MDATERARLRALCETATPGPWECNGVSVDPEDGYVFARQGANIRGTLIVLDDTYERCGSDMLFVAASRTALPALLDDADAADARIAKAERERDEAVAMLRNLLARVHRDGGQHVDAVGLAQATEEADEIIARAFAELACLRAPRPSAIVLRPVDPMTARGLPCACDEWGPGHLDGCPNGDAEPVDAPVPFDDEDLALADGDRRALDAAERERDEARAEAARLRASETGRREFTAAVLDSMRQIGREEEREACAVICDALGDAAEVERDACCDDRSRSLHAGRMHGADECARAIRARGAGGGM